MTYSQKVARAFEIADYFLLIPAILGVLVATSLVKIMIVSLAIYGVILIGLILMVGYFKHSRGRLSKEWVLRLWIGSAVYNFGLLMPLIYFIYFQAMRFINDTNYQMSWEDFLKFFIILFGYTIAVFVSIKSYLSERQIKNIGNVP